MSDPVFFKFLVKAVDYSIHTRHKDGREVSHLYTMRRALLRAPAGIPVFEVLDRDQLQDLLVVLRRFERSCHVGGNELRELRAHGPERLEQIERAITYIRQVKGGAKPGPRPGETPPSPTVISALARRLRSGN